MNKDKKTAGEHRDFDVIERINEVKNRGKDSEPENAQANSKITVSDIEKEKIMLEHENSMNQTKITVSDVEKEKLKLQHETSMRQASEKRIKGWATKSKVTGLVGLGAFALASVMDTSEALNEKKDVSRMTEEQERNLAKKQKQEEKNQSQYAYGHLNAGDIVGEMWNNRLGHHKMGNAKFQ